MEPANMLAADDRNNTGVLPRVRRERGVTGVKHIECI
jgi:hypothetical protein